MGGPSRLSATPAELKTTVIPFLLRGVNLLGIDSVMPPQEERQEAWHRLAQELPLDKLGATVAAIAAAKVRQEGRFKMRVSSVR